jgi:hypothetical protein
MTTAAERAREAIERATQETEAAVLEVADAHESWQIAAAFATAVAAAASHAARFRSVAARRIKDQEKLSLRGLAERIDVSPTRADQLIKASAGGKPDD